MTESEAIATASVPQPDDSRITIILDGQTSTPKAIDFYKVSPFTLMAIGEWLLLKGKQMIAAAEAAEISGKIAIPDPPSVTGILRANK